MLSAFVERLTFLTGVNGTTFARVPPNYELCAVLRAYDVLVKAVYCAVQYCSCYSPVDAATQNKRVSHYITAPQ